MESTGMNWLAVAAAAVAYMILGAIWYSPFVFGRVWMKQLGKTKEQIDADFSPINYFWALITAFIAAYGTARILVWTHGAGISDGILTSLLIGVCFVMTTMGVNDVFEGRSRCLSIVNILYHVVGFVVIGIIVTAWQ